MAKFNPEIPEQTPPQYNPSSTLTPSADTSRATMIAGLTDAFKNVVAGTDMLIKESADTALRKGYDQTLSDFGIPQAADQLSAETRGPVTSENTLADYAKGQAQPGTATVPSQSPSGAPGQPLSLAPPGSDVLPSTRSVPVGVQSAAGQMDTLRAAYRMGGIPEAYYWARMNSLLRSVKSQYPGYEDYIDSKFRTIVGEPTANHLRQTLLDALGKQSPEEKAYQQEVVHASHDGTLPPDFWKRQQQGNPYTYPELMQYTGRKHRENFELDQLGKKVAADKAAGTLTYDQAVKSYRSEAVTTATSMLHDMTTAAGKAWSELSAKLPDWRAQAASGSLPPDQQQHIRLLLNTIEQNVQQKLAATATKQLGGSTDPNARYSTLIKKEDIDQANAVAMQPFEIAKTAIMSGDKGGIGVLAGIDNYLKATADYNGAQLMKHIPQMQVLSAMTKALGAPVTAMFLQMKGEVADKLVANLIDANWGQAWLTGDTQSTMYDGMVAAKHQLGDDKAKAEDYNAKSLKVWSNQMDAIASGDKRMSPDTAAKVFAYGLAPKNYAILAELPPADRRRFFMAMAGPKTFAAAIKLKQAGDTQSWEVYKNYVLNGFQALARQDVASLKNFNEDQTPYVFHWDPKGMKFVADPNPNKTKAGGVFGYPAAKEIGDSVTRLNNLLSVIAPVFNAEGVNTGEVLGRWFNAIGLQSNAGPASNSVLNGMAGSVMQQHPPNPDQQGAPNPFDVGARQPAAIPVKPAGYDKAADMSKRMQNMASLQDFKTYHPEEQHAMLERAIRPELFPTHGPDPHRDKNLFSSGRAARFGIPGGISQNLTSFTVNGQPVMVNKLAAPHFEGFIRALEAEGYKIRTISGFSPRLKRGGTTPSEHAYGNAIDINADTNQFHSNKTDLPKNVALLARRYGLIWGGEWRGTSRDPMHFEWSGQLGTADTQIAGMGMAGLPAQKPQGQDAAQPTEQPLAPREQNHLGQAADALDLTAPELMLYEQHLINLRGNGKVVNDDGSVSTIKNITAKIDGMTYVLPTVWDGKFHSASEAVAHAKEVGLRKFPAYNSEQEAEKRYNAMHKYMDMDVRDYLKKQKNNG